ECLEIFKSINELISLNKMNQIFEHKDLKKYSKIKIYLALCIFKEINLIDFNESGYIVNNSGLKRDLNNSILYKLSFND
ncbi:MAG: hypothetical protein K5765_05840, partial [Clostridia bacterium]|nr:hypothetical protein [Clostridia bacterium]